MAKALHTSSLFSLIGVMFWLLFHGIHAGGKEHLFDEPGCLVVELTAETHGKALR